MSSSNSSSLCLRCLRRAVNGIETSRLSDASQRAAFSTSRIAQAPPPTAATRRKTLKLSKNVRSDGGRRPDPGERKALRKKIVLNNINAIDVKGMSTIKISSEEMRDFYGQVVALPEKSVEKLKSLQAFKHTQGWGHFSRPATLVRKETVDIARYFEKSKSTVRRVLTGERGSGKSVLQLQAMAIALQRGWVVIHIPEAQELTIAHTAYEPISTPEGIQYVQPDAIAELLKNTAAANSAVLSKLRLSKEHKLSVPLKANVTLEELALIGARDSSLAWPVWKIFWAELLEPSPKADAVEGEESAKSANGLQRPKILFTMDSIDHVMRDSAYLNRKAEPIHAHDLALVNVFLSALSGRTQLPNGGIVLGATSGSNVPSTPTLQQLLRQKGHQGIKENWDPYVAHDKRVQEVMKDVPVINVSGLAKPEARGILEYYAQSGLLRDTVTESFVGEKWTISGGGVIGEIEKASVRTRF